jgi:dihydroxyacid dehydratase/phosphogluconate dehydratase
MGPGRASTPGYPGLTARKGPLLAKTNPATPAHCPWDAHRAGGIAWVTRALGGALGDLGLPAMGALTVIGLALGENLMGARWRAGGHEGRGLGLLQRRAA